MDEILMVPVKQTEQFTIKLDKKQFEELIRFSYDIPDDAKILYYHIVMWGTKVNSFTAVFEKEVG